MLTSLRKITTAFIVAVFIQFNALGNPHLAGSEATDNTIIRNVPAFPGATGGGRYTTGGRGGIVLRVTNLNDSGPGSFREALNTEGTRTIVFDVSGNIKLESRITVRHGNLTIAGQTAPGDGITIKGHQVRIAANNVIIRFIRFRPGDIAGREYDAITIIGQRDIIIDRCSMSWGIDETATFYNNENFTLQWSIISESLNNSIHSKGRHGYGGIWGGKHASFNYNILAHHYSRNPRLSGNRPEEGQTLDLEKVELINNIIYNWGDRAIYGGERGYYSIINNHFIPGPATVRRDETMVLIPYAPYGRFFFNGNVLHIGKNLMQLDRDDVDVDNDVVNDVVLFSPLIFPISSQIYNQRRAYRDVLKRAGASLARDIIDQRIIKEIKGQKHTYGNNGIIDSQNDVGGWPELKSNPPKPDNDGDGMPDKWETARGLDPKIATDGNAFSIHTSYTNLEVYLNSLIK